MHDGIMNKITDLVTRYNEALAPYGVKCTVSKRYFETEVTEKHHNPSAGIFNVIDNIIHEKREKKFGHLKNRYHCVILCFSPTEKNIVNKEYCKEYAFLLRKNERLHIGDAPEETVYREEKILSKIEKRLQKILRKAEGPSPEKICKDTWGDALRYLHAKYGYKKRILGKGPFFWDMVFSSVVFLIAIAVVLCTWALGMLLR